MIDPQTDHFIICGYGRAGRHAARDLGLAGMPCVVIDADPPGGDRAAAPGRFVEAHPADDDVLAGAGIARARAVIACMDSDADNIFVVLTARGLRPDVLIVARASSEDAERKLKRVGADCVVSPEETSGSEIARVALHPPLAGATARAAEIEVRPR